MQHKNFVFMKVGQHAGESFENILARKTQEYHRTGMIFWGYGGSACHPLTQVRPFVKSVVENKGRVHLLMEPINSKANPDLLPATEYSEDGLHWKPIPEGIRVTGSKYAIVLGEIKPDEFEVSLETYSVAVGNSRGKPAPEYLQGRVDKACLTFDPKNASVSMSKVAKVGFSAPILDPYAVILRGGSSRQ